VVQYVAACCSYLHDRMWSVRVCCGVMQRIAVCCSLVQCVAV